MSAPPPNVPPSAAAPRPGGYREVLRLAYPLILSTSSFTVMQFVDRIFLARYSATAIQAALPGGILAFTLISGFMALAGYASTFVAQYHGANDPVGCSRATAQGVFLALFSWPLMWLLIPLGRLLLRLSGHAPEVLAQEEVFLTILLAGGVQVPLSAAISSYFTGRGDTLTNMIAAVINNLVNILLDYVLIFGHWGFPALGIAGAAWANVVAGFVHPAILLALYFSRRHNTSHATRRTFRPDWPLMGRMLRFGLPAAVHLLLDVGAFTVFVLLVGRLGTTALAASNIALSINNVAFMPLIGISIAASILVGQYQGRHASDLAARAGWTSLKIGAIYMALIAVTFVLLPRQYFSLFAGHGEGGLQLEQLLPVGRWLLLMMAAWGLLDAVNLILAGALKGAGDTRFVMWYSVAMGWGFWLIGEGLILFYWKAGVLPAWLWMTVYVIVMAGGFVWRFRSGRWRRIELLDRPADSWPAARPAADALTAVD